jgi:hypothetical protein
MMLALAAILVGLDANAVEIFRFQFHGPMIMAEGSAHRNMNR